MVAMLDNRIHEFTSRLPEAEIKTLLSVMRGWPGMRALSSKNPLFASIAAQFSNVIDAVNVPR